MSASDRLLTPEDAIDELRAECMFVAARDVHVAISNGSIRSARLNGRIVVRLADVRKVARPLEATNFVMPRGSTR